LDPAFFRDGDARNARLNSIPIFKMNTTRGIFETFPNQPGDRKDSPFSVASQSESGQPAAQQSPFSALEKQSSPFTVVDDDAGAKSAEFGKPAKLPERKKSDSPFQVAEPSEGFGFVAPAPAASPFETPPPVPAYPPLSTPAESAAAFPFSSPPQFPAPAPQAFAAAAPSAANVPSAFTPAPQAPVSQPDSGDFLSDSSSIRQLELRAIFGVDRELSADEILQRARALSGIRGLARVGAKEMATIEGLKNLLPSLGLGGGPLKLYSGSVPIDFIREGPVVLAIQTDGSFAPGVRETLMIVARELGRLG
jgi:hypothetical protein